MRIRRARMTAALTLLTLAGALAACGDEAADDGKLHVVAGFYPLQYATERVGGDRVSVINLASPGVEPHDLELTPGDVRKLADADLVVHLAGFQPALDAAVSEDKGAAFDASGAARLDRTAVSEDGKSTSQPDPHFWLDPMRLADVADALATSLTAEDPDGAATFKANATALRTELTGLDSEFRTGLANCQSKSLVTGHYAFGYLAARYGLEQVAITGLRPEGEPSPADLTSITNYVKTNDVRAVYSEVLVNSAVVKTIADETGARVLVLDPIEGLTTADADQNYQSLMRADLATLRDGQQCR